MIGVLAVFTVNFWVDGFCDYAIRFLPVWLLLVAAESLYVSDMVLTLEELAL